MKRVNYWTAFNQTISRLVFYLLLTHACLSSAPSRALAQIQIGTVRVTVIDPAADVFAGAVATLANRLTGYSQSATTDERGVATFNNVPFDDYELPRFQQAARRFTVRSNLPVEVEIRLAIPGSRESVTVEAEAGLIERDSSSSEQDLNERSNQRWIIPYR